MGQRVRASEASRPWWALAVGVLALLGAAYLAVDPAGGGPDEAGAPMMDVAPGGELAFEDIPEQQRAQYLAAAADAETFAAVRCYCGCEGFLDHENLLRCFVRDDGAWERHATGCGICLAQADMVVDLRERGWSVTEVVEAVDDHYATILPTT
jgi:hypothetical protein